MITKPLLRLALLLFAVSSLAGCFEPIQGGGVVIIGDPSERLEAFCRFRSKAAGADPFCAAEPPPAAEPVTTRAQPMQGAVTVVEPGKVTRLDSITSVFDGAPQIPQKE